MTLIFRFLLPLILFAFVFSMPVSADTIVEITPLKRITTAGEKLSEGDYVKFKVLDNGEIIEGLVVKYEPNGFGGQTAVLVIEDFRTIEGNNKYFGTIALEGNQHNGIMEFFADMFADIVRGGEVTISPKKDKFTIWRKE